MVVRESDPSMASRPVWLFEISGPQKEGTIDAKRVVAGQHVMLDVYMEYCHPGRAFQQQISKWQSLFQLVEGSPVMYLCVGSKNSLS